MDNLPKRDSSQYIAVENFRDFEVTNCISYEMAIRNDGTINAIKRFLEKFINEDLNEIKFITDTSCFKKAQNEAQILMKQYSINPLELYLEYDFLQDSTNKLKDILESLKNTQENVDNLEYTNLKQIIFETNLNHESKSSPEDDKKIAQLMERALPKENEYTYYKVKNFYESFVQYKEGKIKDFKHILTQNEYASSDKDKTIQVLENNWIKPRYIRPELQKSFMKSYKRNVEIDFTLSTKELTDFIKRLKQEHSIKENHLTKNPSELLGEYIKEYDLPKGYPKNKDKGFTLQDKWADLFFIYDYYKVSKKNFPEKTDIEIYVNIDNELKDYHDKDNINTYWKSTDVYRKILEPLKELIDNLRYKELI